MACTYPIPSPKHCSTFPGGWEGAHGLWPPQGHPVTHRRGKIMDLQPILPSLHCPLCSFNGLKPLPHPPPCVPLQSATSNSQINGNSFWQGFFPFSSYFKSSHIFPRSSMEQQWFTTELALLATFCYLLSYLWLQNKMLLILVSSGDQQVSNTSLTHQDL